MRHRERALIPWNVAPGIQQQLEDIALVRVVGAGSPVGQGQDAADMVLVGVGDVDDVELLVICS